MLSMLKDLFKPAKDYSGRNISTVISCLAKQTKTNPYAWSYIQDTSVYENTMNGKKVYLHELTQYTA